MADQFTGQQTPMQGPASFAEAITPSDSADLAFTSRGLYLDVAGTVTVNMAGNGAGSGDAGYNVAFTLDKGLHPLRVTRVWATGTDSGLGIKAVW